MLRNVRQFLRSLRIGAERPPERAITLSGGGARGAYQTGILKYIAETFPHASFPIMTGVSAGAINVGHMANHVGTFREGVDKLLDCWLEIEPEKVFVSESSFQFFWNLYRRSRANGDQDIFQHKGLLDTSPLRSFLAEKLGVSKTQPMLTGVGRNLQEGRLKAAALLTTSYTTAQTVSWVQGRDVRHWERPDRISIQTTLSLDHIMASTALPLVFPAIRLGKAWYGDGGVRLAAPLAPTVHLGATHILAIATRYDRSSSEAATPLIQGYPPTAQVLSVLMNAVFLDALDQDALMMQRINDLLEQTPRRNWNGLRPIHLLLIRPSRDLGRLAGDYQFDTSGILDLLITQLGSKETESPDWLSMLLFHRPYIETVIDIGYTDARNQYDALARFFSTD